LEREEGRKGRVSGRKKRTRVDREKKGRRMVRSVTGDLWILWGRRNQRGGKLVKLDSMHDMWCERCGPKREWLNREVRAGRKSKMSCTECGKKWVAAKKENVETGECNECKESRGRREAARPKKVKAQPREEVKGERDVRRTIKILREVWMQVGLEKVDTHEGVSVKVLLDSSATGMFADKKFVEKNGFRLEKLERPVRIRNVDGTGNSGGLVTHVIEVNVYYRGHVERMKLDVCDLGRTEVILGMPWLAAHNLEINWETEEVKMTRCPPLCGKNKEKKEKWEVKEVRRRGSEEDAAIRWMADEKED